MTDTTASGARGWLTTRSKVALGIAFVEGLIVWVGHDLTRWMVFGIAIPLVVLYFAAGRTSKYRLVREVTWIAAASQSLAIVLVILAWVLKVLVLVLAVACAVVALLFLFTDRGGKG
jgi:hypothetical protein